jgi:hypothetical protein
MALLNTEQLNALALNMGLFQPSGQNDEHRIDLSGGAPFVSIDTCSPYEIDDAIRVKIRRNGGFILQVAIADGAQIPYPSKIATEALDTKASTYVNKRCLVSMLPELAIRQMELIPAHNPQRALVVESRFDSYGQAEDDVTVFPGTINVEAYRYSEFASRYLRYNGGPKAPIARFVETFRSTRDDLQYDLPVAHGGSKTNVQYGSEVTQDCMVLTNLGFTSYCRKQNIPALHRRFATVELAWGGPRIDAAIHILNDEPAPEEGIVPYARATSPLHEGVY